MWNSKLKDYEKGKLENGDSDHHQHLDCHCNHHGCEQLHEMKQKRESFGLPFLFHLMLLRLFIKSDRNFFHKFQFHPLPLHRNHLKVLKEFGDFHNIVESAGRFFI